VGHEQRDLSDDAVLVAALRARDDAAFAWLLDRYDRSLHRVAMSFVPSRAVADEVVQETWLGVLRGIDGFEGRSSLKTWIFRILMNVGRTRGEREQRTVPFTSALDDGESSFAPDRFRTTGPYPRHWARSPEPWDEQPADHLLASETLEVVRAAIDQLPANQRTVICLRDIDGWTSVDVCALLDVSEANQRVLLHRARARVRQTLEDYFGGAAS
jgi:RNA polymerase sigma-70 factor (ECF subfamily)